MKKATKLLALGALGALILISCKKEELNITDVNQDQVGKDIELSQEALEQIRKDSIEDAKFEVITINSMDDFKQGDVEVSFASPEECRHEIKSAKEDRSYHLPVTDRIEFFSNTNYDATNGHMHIANAMYSPGSHMDYRWNLFYKAYSRPADYKGGIKYNDERYITVYGFYPHREVKRWNHFTGYQWNLNHSVRGGNVGSLQAKVGTRTRVYLIVVDEDGNRHGALRLSNYSYSQTHWINIPDMGSIALANGYTARNVSKFYFTKL